MHFGCRRKQDSAGLGSRTLATAPGALLEGAAAGRKNLRAASPRARASPPQVENEIGEKIGLVRASRCALLFSLICSVNGVLFGGQEGAARLGLLRRISKQARPCAISPGLDLATLVFDGLPARSCRGCSVRDPSPPHGWLRVVCYAYSSSTSTPVTQLHSLRNNML